MPGMTDRNTGGNNLVNKLMQALYSSSTTFTITPGTSGGSPFTITPPFFLRLMTAVGSNTSNGTQLTGATGYSAGGSTLGTSAFGAPSGGVSTNNNSVSWSVGSSWTTVTSIEVWDSTSGTNLRYLQGALTSNITGAANGDTVQFAAASVSADADAW